MSLRLKHKDSITSPVSNGFEKPNKNLSLFRIYTAAWKSLLSKKALGLVIVILVLCNVFDVFRNPKPSSVISQTLQAFSSTNGTDIITTREDLQDYYPEKPVKLYVYDLPYRFTYEIIEHHYTFHSNRRVEDVTKLNYPAHQHMAEWYIFKDLMQADSNRPGNSPIVRVNDPDEAELFYIPFFSSLSMIVTRLRQEGSGQPRYNDEKMQRSLIKWLEGKESWRRNKGRDHVIIASDPNAYHHVMDRVKNCAMLLAGFGRLTTDQGSLEKDVVVPYAHRVNVYKGEVGVDNRDTLLFFMGARYRKEGGKIRDLLFDILENEENVVMKQGTQTKEDRRAFTRGMHTSKFCLNPAGDTSTSCRLFDSIVSLCVPVIVSDELELPFEDVIDYTKIAIFVPTEDALKPGFLASMLRAVPDEKIIEYQEELKEVKPYFDFRSETLNQIWREVIHKLPSMKLMINRQKRLIKTNNPSCSCLCTNQTTETETVLI